MRRLIVLLASLGSPLSLVAQAPGGVSEAANSIKPKDIQHRIEVIADDSMRGRDTPSPELDKVAAFIAAEFARFGLKPGGDRGTFLQRYEISRSRVDTAASSIAVSGGPTLRFGPDAALMLGAAEGGVSGPVVAIRGTPQDAGALKGLALHNAVVVLVAPARTENFPPNRSWFSVLRAARAEGPAAIVIVYDVAEAQWGGLAAGQRRARLAPTWTSASAAGSPPLIAVRDAAIGPVLAAHGFDLAVARRDATKPAEAQRLADLSLTITVKQEATDRASAPNAVGILEGSDPELKKEYVVFSAHMDHVGVGQPDTRGDSIYNGADDDASGTIAVVENAEAFARLSPAPRRSMIFLTVSGEEKGLWGSEYFVNHSPVPIEQIVADLNTDMVGRNWKDTIVAIGKEHSDLGATLNQVNRQHPELRMTAIDDIWPDESFYTRSDHYNFARKGVPILFFFNGTHPDYHRPGDEPSKIDSEKESRIVKLVFYLGLEIANAKTRPQWVAESLKQVMQGGR